MLEKEEEIKNLKRKIYFISLPIKILIVLIIFSALYQPGVIMSSNSAIGRLIAAVVFIDSIFVFKYSLRLIRNQRSIKDQSLSMGISMLIFSIIIILFLGLLLLT